MKKKTIEIMKNQVNCVVPTLCAGLVTAKKLDLCYDSEKNHQEISGVKRGMMRL